MGAHSNSSKGLRNCESVTLQIELFTNHTVARRLTDIRPAIFVPVIEHFHLCNKRCKSWVLTEWRHVGTPEIPDNLISIEFIHVKSHSDHSKSFIVRGSLQRPESSGTHNCRLFLYAAR